MEVVAPESQPSYSPYQSTPSRAAHLASYRYTKESHPPPGKTGPILTPRIREYLGWTQEQLEALQPRQMTMADSIARTLLLKSLDLRYGDKAREQVLARVDGPIGPVEQPASTVFSTMIAAAATAYVDRLVELGLPLPLPAPAIDETATSSDNS